MRRVFVAVLVVLSLLGFGACSGTATPTSGLSTTAPQGLSQARWDSIRKQLTDKGIKKIDRVEVVDVTWSDSSLGCPEPDKAYAQPIVEGQRVVIVVGDDTYDFRFGDTDNAVLCNQPSAAPGTPRRS